MRRTNEKRPAAPPSGFTRLDLVGSIAAFFLLCCVAMPCLAGLGRDSRWLVSMSNLRRLTAAWNCYAQDNGGGLPPNSSSSQSGKTLGQSSWAGGGLAATFNTGDSTNTSFLVNPYGRWPDGVIRHYSGLLGYYEQDVRLFQSPGGSVRTNGVEWPRIRCYSMNGLIIGPSKAVDGWVQHAINSRYDVFRSLSDFKTARPASTFVLITERPDEIGVASFSVGEGSPPKVPAFHENGGANLSFADGHVENWQWRGPVFSGRQKAPLFPNPLGPQDQLDADRLWRAATAR